MAETWILNSRIDDRTNRTFSIDFVSSNNFFSLIEVRYRQAQTSLRYDSVIVYGNGSWTNEAYRTVVFDIAPTGDLLTWLQANGTKQADPEPTTPKNACLIDGTAYSIKSGKTLISGTVYTIKKGRTLIGGTGYNIILAESTIPITVVGGVTSAPRDFATAYAIYNGQKYVDTTFEVQPGDTVQIYLKAQSRSFARRQRISLNGVNVSSGTGNLVLSYDYIPTKPATITISMYPVTMPDKQYSTAAIVETG